jgi:hypothetical protein
MKSEIIKFMGATGNLKDITSKDVFFEEVGKLIPLIQEEVDELKESYQLRYVQGVLDDVVDIEVYLVQLQSLLERLGCNTTLARASVAENNSLKYTTSGMLAMRWLNEHSTQYKALKQGNPFYISTTEYEGEMYYCLKRKVDDKVSKWCGFPKVSLDDFVPSEFGGSL